MGFPAQPDSACVTRVVPSPNFRAQQAGEKWDYIVLHGTWMADDEAVIRTLCDPVKEVSAHYFISHEHGHETAGGVETVQLVGEQNVAWHAGKSAWAGREMLNGCALGIEIGNYGLFPNGPPDKSAEAIALTTADWQRAEPYTAKQYAALIALLKDLLARHGLGPAVVLGHDEIAPGRKSDPGRHFDWEVLVKAGVAVARPL